LSDRVNNNADLQVSGMLTTEGMRHIPTLSQQTGDATGRVPRADARLVSPAVRRMARGCGNRATSRHHDISISNLNGGVYKLQEGLGLGIGDPLWVVIHSLWIKVGILCPWYI